MADTFNLVSKFVNSVAKTISLLKEKIDVV